MGAVITDGCKAIRGKSPNEFIALIDRQRVSERKLSRSARPSRGSNEEMLVTRFGIAPVYDVTNVESSTMIPPISRKIANPEDTSSKDMRARVGGQNARISAHFQFDQHPTSRVPSLPPAGISRRKGRGGKSENGRTGITYFDAYPKFPRDTT